MADATRRVSVRLSLDDAARVKAGLREVGDTGQRSLDQIKGGAPVTKTMQSACSSEIDATIDKAVVFNDKLLAEKDRLDKQSDVVAYRSEVTAMLEQLRETLRQNSDNANALNDLAWVLATTPVDALRNGREAVRCAERAVKLTQGHEAGMLDTLGVAYAETGAFRRAAEYARQALVLARAKRLESMIGPLTHRLKLFSQEKPFRDEN